MAKVRHYRFRTRNPLNLTEVGVAKHKVGVANLKVGGAAAQPVQETPPVICTHVGNWNYAREISRAERCGGAL